jgi:hypothetical protein
MASQFYFNHLTIFTFIALYIISLVFLFRINTEIVSFYVLTIFQGFFILFIIQTLLTYDIRKLMFIPMLMMASVIIASTLKFVSLIFILIMFKNLNIGYEIEEIGNKKLPSQYRKYMNDYKILFTVDVAFIIFTLLIFMIQFDGLQTIHFSTLMTAVLNGKDFQAGELISSMFAFILSVGIMVASAGELYIGNKFSKIHKKRIQI